MEQLQRLIVLDTKAAAEPGTVRRKAVEHLRAPTFTAATHFLPQGGDVRAEVGEVRRNRQVSLGADKEACRLRLSVLHPEDLCQRHRLVVTSVVKNTQDDRIVVVVPQCHGFGGAGHVVALGLVMTEHVGAQRTFLAVSTGGLVVGDAMCGYQQRGDRVDQG
jgi:hypothetical protein